MPAGIDGLKTRDVAVSGGSIRVALGGRGPPLLLLHGFPQTHIMWRAIAPLLAQRFSVVCADLPGQGGSSPFGGDAPYAKRGMARILAAMMATLGHSRFAVAGHDRGARVAYRLALDHPGAVTRLAVLDIIPVLDAFDHADDRMMLSFWPWSLMAQPEPLPERLVAAAPEAVVADSIAQWGTDPAVFDEPTRRAYTEALFNPVAVHAICEEFRAAAGIDRDHDRADRAAGRTISQPTLVLWDEAGALDKWYQAHGGPLGIWRRWASQVDGEAVSGGHFFPEAEPQATAVRLERFFAG